MIAALLLGVFSKRLEYKIFVSGKSMPFLNNSFLAYLYISCVFVLPVILMWIFTIMTFVFYKKYLKKRQNIISTKAHKQEMKKQVRLLFTLGIMVIVFSVSILPMVISCVFLFYDPIRSFKSMRTIVTIILCSLVMCASNSFGIFLFTASVTKHLEHHPKTCTKDCYVA